MKHGIKEMKAIKGRISNDDIIAAEFGNEILDMLKNHLKDVSDIVNLKAPLTDITMRTAKNALSSASIIRVAIIDLAEFHSHSDLEEVIGALKQEVESIYEDIKSEFTLIAASYIN